MNRLIISLLCIVNMVAINIHAESFKEYCDELKTLDITLKCPKGFKPIDVTGNFILKINNNVPAEEMSEYWAYPVVLESNNNQCAILLPVILADNPMMFMGKVVENELRTAYSDMNRDINGDIAIIPVGEKKGYAGIDTLVQYDLKIAEPVMGKYNHCIGLLLRKYAHQSMLVKICLTDEGYANKEIYIKELLQNIRYGNMQNPKCVSREKIMNGDLKFPKSERWNTGIIVDCIKQIQLENDINFKKGATPIIYNPK